MAGEAKCAATSRGTQDADRLSMAQRHVIEAEESVARQRAMVTQLVKDHHKRAAVLARNTLRTLENTLQLAREHLSIETQVSIPGGSVEIAISLPPAGEETAETKPKAARRKVARNRHKAQDHVASAERHVAHQREIISVLEQNGHRRALALAREVLTTLEHSLEITRRHLKPEAEGMCAGGLSPDEPGTLKDNPRPAAMQQRRLRSEQ